MGTPRMWSVLFPCLVAGVLSSPPAVGARGTATPLLKSGRAVTTSLAFVRGEEALERRFGFDGGAAQRVRFELKPADPEAATAMYTITDANGVELQLRAGPLSGGGTALELLLPTKGRYELRLWGYSPEAFTLRFDALEVIEAKPLSIGNVVKVPLVANVPALLRWEVPSVARLGTFRVTTTGVGALAEVRLDPNGGDLECEEIACRGPRVTWRASHDLYFIELSAPGPEEATVLLEPEDALAKALLQARTLTIGERVKESFTAPPAGQAGDGSAFRRSFLFEWPKGPVPALRVDATTFGPHEELLELREDATSRVLSPETLDGLTTIPLTPGRWLLLVEPGPPVPPGPHAFTLQLQVPPDHSPAMRFFGLPGPGPFSSRVAVVDYQRLLDASSDGRRERAALESLFAQSQGQLDARKQLVESLRGEAQRTAAAEATELYQHLTRTTSIRKDEAEARLREKTFALAAELRRKRGLALLVNMEQVLWVAPTLDLTEAMVQAFDAGAVVPGAPVPESRVAVVDMSVVEQQSARGRAALAQVAKALSPGERERLEAEEFGRLFADCQRAIAQVATLRGVNLVLWASGPTDPVAQVAWKVPPMALSAELSAALDRPAPAP